MRTSARALVQTHHQTYIAYIGVMFPDDARIANARSHPAARGQVSDRLGGQFLPEQTAVARQRQCAHSQTLHGMHSSA